MWEGLCSALKVHYTLIYILYSHDVNHTRNSLFFCRLKISDIIIKNTYYKASVEEKGCGFLFIYIFDKIKSWCDIIKIWHTHVRIVFTGTNETIKQSSLK